MAVLEALFRPELLHTPVNETQFTFECAIVSLRWERILNIYVSSHLFEAAERIFFADSFRNYFGFRRDGFFPFQSCYSQEST